MKRYIALHTIVKYGSFSAAAEKLGYTQSAISQMITNLENEFGFRLLNRSKQGVSLTPEGRDIYPYIVQTLNSARSLNERAQEIHDMESGIVRLAAIESVTINWLPLLIDSFHALHPKVEFEIYEHNYAGLTDAITKDEVDFIIIAPEAAGGLTLRHIKTQQMLAVLPKDHPLTAYEAVPLYEFAQEPSIFLEDAPFHEPVEVLKNLELHSSTPFTVHDSDYAIMAMVERGMGVSILSELMLYGSPFDLALRPTDPPIYRSLAIAFKNDRVLPIATKNFIEHILKNKDMLP